METRHGGNGRNAIRMNYLHGSAVTSMRTPIHKQGYVGDLMQQSKCYLQDLLKRQEKMLNNRAFIQRLPDKGEKIQNFAKTLKDLITAKEQEESCILNTSMPNSVAPHNPCRDSVENTQNFDENCFGIEETTHANTFMQNEDLKIIEKGFDKLSIHEGLFYDVVVNAEKRKHKSKFALNRTHNSEMKVGAQPASLEQTTQEHKQKELTSASIRDPVHGSTQVISIEESRAIYSSENKKIQELKAQRITERLMKPMNTEYVMHLPVSTQEDREHMEPQQENEENITESYSEEFKESYIDLEAVD